MAGAERWESGADERSEAPRVRVRHAGAEQVPTVRLGEELIKDIPNHPVGQFKHETAPQDQPEWRVPVDHDSLAFSAQRLRCCKRIWLRGLVTFRIVRPVFIHPAF
jgi:hypothetical protein